MKGQQLVRMYRELQDILDSSDDVETKFFRLQDYRRSIGSKRYWDFVLGGGTTPSLRRENGSHDLEPEGMQQVFDYCLKKQIEISYRAVLEEIQLFIEALEINLANS